MSQTITRLVTSCRKLQSTAGNELSEAAINWATGSLETIREGMPLLGILAAQEPLFLKTADLLGLKLSLDRYPTLLPGEAFSVQSLCGEQADANLSLP